MVKAKQIVLRDSARLVTFTGPGGIGKTRLALQVAHELKEQFDGGVLLREPVDDQPTRTSCPQVVAQACGVRSSAQSPPLEAIAST